MCTLRAWLALPRAFRVLASIDTIIGTFIVAIGWATESGTFWAVSICTCAWADYSTAWFLTHPHTILSFAANCLTLRWGTDRLAYLITAS